MTNSAPTVEEMLAWLKQTAMDSYEGDTREIIAIRAVLLQHRLWGDIHALAGHSAIDPKVALAGIRLEAVKAFVNRAEKRLPPYNTGTGADSWLKAYRQAVHDELAEMEKGGA